MLIISQPKSASSSFQKAFSVLLKWPEANQYKNQKPRPEGFSHLPHRDMVNYSAQEFRDMADSKKIYKVHAPPTEANIRNLRESKARVLLTLRNPECAIKAYKRHCHLNNSPDPKRFIPDEWRWEMAQFFQGWRDAANDTGFGYRIHPFFFADITENPATQIYWGSIHLGISCQIPEDFRLPKVRFSQK